MKKTIVILIASFVCAHSLCAQKGKYEYSIQGDDRMYGLSDSLVSGIENNIKQIDSLCVRLFQKAKNIQKKKVAFWEIEDTTFKTIELRVEFKDTFMCKRITQGDTLLEDAIQSKRILFIYQPNTQNEQYSCTFTMINNLMIAEYFGPLRGKKNSAYFRCDKNLSLEEFLEQIDRLKKVLSERIRYF
jgi:hypothetical protein